MRWFGSNKDNGVDRSPGGRLKLPLLDSSKIKSVMDLDAKHFVFLVTFNDGEKMVLKAESGVNTQTKKGTHDLGVRIMGVVSPVKAETLTAAEKVHLGRLDNGITAGFFRAERFVDAGLGDWVKATYQQGLTGFKGYAQIERERDDGFREVDPVKKAEAKVHMMDLNLKLKNNIKAWNSLGRVVAVDMFIANGDRISLHAGSFVNMGNIQFRTKGKKIEEAVGLDTFDPSSANGAGDLYATDISDWKDEYGIYLKDLNQARAKLRECMQSGTEEINRMFGTGTCSWSEKETKAFVDGYTKGVDMLKKKLKLEAPKLAKMGNAAPKGALLKMNWLGQGWI